MKQKFLYLIAFLFISVPLFSIDNAHFYKAPLFHGSNQFKDKDWLSKIDLIYANGSTHRGRDSNGDKVQAFDIYGHHNLLNIFAGINTEDAPAEIRKLASDLEAKRIAFEALSAEAKKGKENFGKVIFSGKFETDEFVIDINQNLKKNFFIQLNIPFRRVNVSKLDYSDTSSVNTTLDDTNYTTSDGTWTDFLKTFSAGSVMNAYGLTNYNNGFVKSGFGDININVGWRHEWLDPVDFLEFVKIVLKGGIQFPTGIKTHSSHSFALPTGYNGHFGFPLRADVLAGLSKDVHLGAHTGLTFFTHKTHSNYRIKTNKNQNGFIKLAEANVQEKKGTLFDLGIYLKLDHFFKGLSALSAYSFNHQSGDSLTLHDAHKNITSVDIMNSDSRLRSWQMHVAHFLVDYDFGVHSFFSKRKIQPHVSFFYNYPFDGKRIFVTPTTGGTLGCEINWKF